MDFLKSAGVVYLAYSAFSCVTLYADSHTKNVNIGIENKVDFIVQPTFIPKELPSITAVLRQYSKHYSSIKDNSWIILSAHGMRVKDEQGNVELIKDFDSRQAWIVNHKKQIVHQFDIPSYAQVFPDAAEYFKSAATSNGVMAQVPCEGYIAKFIAYGTWRGNKVLEWHCLDEQKHLIRKHYFSKKWNLVVRDESPDGQLEEVINIQSKQLDREVFLPNSEFENVSFETFMLAKPSLGSYKEKKN